MDFMLTFFKVATLHKFVVPYPSLKKYFGYSFVYFFYQ